MQQLYACFLEPSGIVFQILVYLVVYWERTSHYSTSLLGTHYVTQVVLELVVVVHLPPKSKENRYMPPCLALSQCFWTIAGNGYRISEWRRGSKIYSTGLVSLKNSMTPSQSEFQMEKWPTPELYFLGVLLYIQSHWPFAGSDSWCFH